MPSHSRTAGDDRPAFDQRQFRDALAQFATGVTIVCTRAPNGRYVGFTANSFNSVSLEPPLILWTIARRSGSLGVFESAERYAVNVLSSEQSDLARRWSVWPSCSPGRPKPRHRPGRHAPRRSSTGNR